MKAFLPSSSISMPKANTPLPVRRIAAGTTRSGDAERRGAARPRVSRATPDGAVAVLSWCWLIPDVPPWRLS